MRLTSGFFKCLKINLQEVFKRAINIIKYQSKCPLNVTIEKNMKMAFFQLVTFSKIKWSFTFNFTANIFPIYQFIIIRTVIKIFHLFARTSIKKVHAVLAIFHFIYSIPLIVMSLYNCYELVNFSLKLFFYVKNMKLQQIYCKIY